MAHNEDNDLDDDDDQHVHREQPNNPLKCLFLFIMTHHTQ
jgi:hypothetical protein